MGIHFISGKPGGGKSLYATKLCFEELRYGTRHIVTNLALNVGELNAYYQKHYDDPYGFMRFRVPWFLGWLWWILPDWLCLKVFPCSPDESMAMIKTPRSENICSRVTVITDDDLPAFFTKRPGCEIASINNADWKKGVRPDYTVVHDAGILFCLDEIHIAFNSRAWADTGAEVLYYLSQHRKLGDDVICITQSVANVDKQFRSVAQDFTYVRNLGKESMGKFRLPARFVRKTYCQPATDTSEPMDTGFFSLDINGIAKCYDTAKGVGIHGRAGADTRERKKGIHWLWFAIGLPLILFLIVKYVPSMLVKHLNHTTPPPVKTNRQPAKVIVPDAGEGETMAVNNPGAAPGAVDAKTNPPVVTCVGWCVDGSGGWLVFTSDGQTYSSADKEVDYIHKRQVSLLGKKYEVKARDPKYKQLELPFSAISALPSQNASHIIAAGVSDAP